MAPRKAFASCGGPRADSCTGLQERTKTDPSFHRRPEYSSRICENPLIMNFFKQLFPPRIDAKSSVPFSGNELAGPAKVNRQTLLQIDDWIDDQAFAASFFNYGVPDPIKAVINKPIGQAITYTDLMLLIATK